MHWWSPFLWIAPSAPLWWYNCHMMRKMWRRKREAKRIREANARQPVPYTGIEPEEYCLGCDEIRPKSWMAFVDEDDDGVPDALYRCRVCRGLGEPVTPEATQEACNERVDGYYRNVEFADNRGDDVCWEIGPGKVVEVHEDSCQCTNCVGWQPLTDEQIENARMQESSLDLAQLLAPEYTAVVAGYRRAGVNATNESDRIYRKRLAKRDARRQELRAKYDMDGDGWRRYVRH